MKILIDFDGTLCEHKFPKIGKEQIGAIAWCKTWIESGAQLILWTRRSNKTIEEYSGYPYKLDDAIQWCKERDLIFHSANPSPETEGWTNSPKPAADLIIDDIGFGIPKGTYLPGNTSQTLEWHIIGPAVLNMILERNRK